MANGTSTFTGRDCKLKVGQTEFSNVVTSYSLTFTADMIEADVLTGGPRSNIGPEKAQLSISFVNDMDDPAGLWQTLYAAAGTEIDFELTAGTQTMSGKVIAKKPDVMASPSEISSCDLELPVTGEVTPGTVAAARTAPKASA